MLNSNFPFKKIENILILKIIKFYNENLIFYYDKVSLNLNESCECILAQKLIIGLFDFSW